MNAQPALARALGALDRILPTRHLRVARSVWQRHFGGAAWIALALIVVLLLTQWQLQPTLRHERERLAARQSALAGAPMPREDTGGPRAALAAGELPSTRQRGRDLEAMTGAAQRAGLVLERADYSAGTAAAGGLLRVEATLPLTGSYAAVRRFVAEVLNELPHSALESLQLERTSAQARELQATARFVLFYAEEAP